MQQALPIPHQRVDLSPKKLREDYDLLSLLWTVWRGKWIILVSCTFAIFLALFSVSGQVPQYRATAKVMFDLDERNITDIEDVIARGDFNSSDIQNQVEVLSSTALIERVVDTLNLSESPAFNPRLRPKPPTFRERFLPWLALPPELSSFGQRIGLVQQPGPAPDPSEVARRERLVVINAVRQGLDLAPIRNSTVINIHYTSVNPRIAARLANTVAEQYIVEQLEGRLAATQSATEWLSDRVLELESKLQTAENAVADAQARLADQAGQTIEVTRAQIAELTSALTSTRAQHAAIQATLTRLERALENNAEISSVPEFRNAPLIQDLRIEESELLSRVVQLEETVGADHPSLRRVNVQLAEVRRKMASEATQIALSVQLELGALDELMAQLSGDVRDLEQKALGQSADEIELRQLEREAQAARLLYENFLNRLQETSQQETLQSADARIISQAEVPTNALSGTRKRTLALGALLGGLVGLGIVVLLQRLNNTFRNVPQLEEAADLPVLASVPIVKRKMHRRDVIEYFRTKPNSSLAEAVRNLRTSILFSNVDSPPKAIMVTSSIPREGKSTTATLIALTSKQMGRSAILVDCDLRLPALANILQFDKDKPGILSYMEGSAELGECLSVEPETGLNVLMARPSETQTTMNAADLLSSQRFRSLIEHLRETYDLVILDSPPALVVTDARIISQIADAVVYAVGWDVTPRGAVIEGLKELRSVEAPLIGTVFTMVNEQRASKYSSDGYGYAYYRSKYSDYYIE